LEFRVLGPFEVAHAGRRVALGGTRQRALLAVLLVHRNQLVGPDRLIDELWGERPPATALKTVQVYVSRLRKALGDGALLTRAGGYILAVEPEQVDADRFAALTAEGRRALRSGDPRVAAERLGAALALWRGPPLADLAYERFAQAEIARLEEARLGAVEDRIEAELALGRHAELVGELEALVREHPLRERLRGQLMLALYRSGRQADALASFRQARGSLVDELGIEPGRALQELERAILTQDPALDPPPAGGGELGQPAARRPRSRGLLIAIGGGLLLVVMSVVAVMLSRSSANPVLVAPNSVAAIDLRSGRVVGAVPVGTRPGAIAFGSGSLWVANRDDQTVSRVDARSLRTLHTISVADPPTGIAASTDGIWVAESGLNPSVSSVSVSRIDPQFDALGSTLKVGNVVPGGSATLAARGDSVWVAPSSGLLTRLDETTGQVVGQVDPNASPTAIAVSLGAVWVTDTEADNVIRVDPTGLLTPIPVGGAPTGIAVGAGGVWVADSLDGTVVRIDPTTRAVTTTIKVGRAPDSVAFGAGSLWVANSGDGTVSRIDPVTDKVLATIAVGGSPQAITIADGRAWVTVDAQSIARINVASVGGTLRIESPTDVDYMDPALGYSLLSGQLLYATCAELVNYPDKAGAAGSQLIPEVAQSLPAHSPDGRTYTFKIRPDFRFSPPSNEPVTAKTFKDTIERTLAPRMHSPLAHYLADVVGAGAYIAGNASHIAGIVASGDALTIRLLSPAPDFLSRIAESAFCAVPSDTPVSPNGVRLIPSAGPYYVASYIPGQGVLLVRNPNYHGNRPRRFERIQLAVGIAAQRTVADVESGSADYTNLGLWTFSATGGSTARGIAALDSELAARYGPGSPAARGVGQRYFINPVLQLDYFDLNTHRPLFSDVRLREAVNYAIDRRALAALGDGYQPLPEHPTDHYLPPGMPGFRETPVYPLTPDLARARRLADGNGRTAVLYTCQVSPCPEQAQIVKTDLAALGLHVQIKTFPLATLPAKFATPGEPFDLAWEGWLPDYPDPYSMLTPLLSDNAIAPSFQDPAYQRRLAAAEPLSGPKRYLTYGELDLDLARKAAPLAAFGNLSSHDFFSARVGCQTYGVYGIDLPALCIKHG
jgi:YVTN family beta-propeller protein